LLMDHHLAERIQDVGLDEALHEHGPTERSSESAAHHDR
jgi:hypothetical protein